MIAVPDPATEPNAEQLQSNWVSVNDRVQAAAASVGREPSEVRLVAVSKTKTVGCLQRAYGVGVRVFGENYVQEIVEKSPQMPADVQWRFIGHLQSNKAKDLVSKVPGLVAIETVDSESLATKLENAVAKHRPDRPLGVLVQVNTSGEESKSGLEPGPAVAELCQHVLTSCPHLQLGGLMTIGMPDFSSRPECFDCLLQCRDDVLKKVQWPANRPFDMSMGMSGDFEAAIRAGSTNVRVGSSIFGARNYKPKVVEAGATTAEASTASETSEKK